MVGGVSAQTALDITGGTNWSAWEEGAEKGTQWGPSDNNHKNGYIRFQDNRSKYSRLGGKVWAETMNSNDTHTFVIVLNNDVKNQWGNPASTLSRFVLCAVKGGEYNGNDLTNSDTYNWYNNDFKTDGDGHQSLKVVATTNVVTGFVDNQLTLTLNITEDYDAVYLYSPDGSSSNYIKIESITRTITTASSVAVPTISPASGTYDEDENLIVTITKGEGNDDVVYSVSGATSGNVTDVHFTSAELSAGFKTLTLTGTGTITVTATGYKNSEASTTVTNTYTTDVPSGKTPIASDNRTLPYTFNSADDNIEFNANRFNNQNIVIGNYVVLDIDVTNDNTWFCFKRGWGDDYFNQCNEISSGQTANNCWVNKNDSYWWMKISDQNACYAFTGNNVQIKGSKIKDTNTYSAMTVNSFSIYESKAISELVDNAIASKINNVVVELTRSLVANTWNTICLPFALTNDQATQLFGSGYKLAAFTGVEGTTMKFSTTNVTFEAGVPYLVKPTETLSAENPVVLVDVNITAKTGATVEHDGYSFVGTFVTKTFTEEEKPSVRLVGTGNKLITPSASSTSAMKALRAYFVLPSASSAPALSIDGEGEATSIEDLENSRTEELNIYYDLSGRRVENPTKGIYIINGKKVVFP